MRLHRFYLKQPLGEEIGVDDNSLLKQWFSVFRYKVGSRVILFNDDNFDYEYEITSHNKDEAILRPQSKKEGVTPRMKISLYLSLIKKDNFEFAVEKGVEIGVSRFVPVVSERSEKKNLNLERLRKIIIEATEQSGRGDIPKIEEITTLLEIVSNPPINPIILDKSGTSSLKEFKESDEISLFIGPEGGFSQSDLEILKALGGKIVKLTDTTLRAETAAILAPGLLLSE